MHGVLLVNYMVLLKIVLVQIHKSIAYCHVAYDRIRYVLYIGLTSFSRPIAYTLLMLNQRQTCIAM